MAKKKNFTTSPSEFKETRLRAGESVGIPVHEHEHKQEHKQTNVQFAEPEQKVNKTKHLHILTHESIVNRMDAYAAKRGVKRVAVFEAAIIAYLDQVDPE